MSSTYNSGFDFTREDVLKMLAAVHSLINETWQAYNQYDKEPASNSLALQEQQTFPNQELIRGVHYGGILSMESASDHLRVFADSIAEPANTAAPLFCHLRATTRGTMDTVRPAQVTNGLKTFGVVDERLNVYHGASIAYGASWNKYQKQSERP
jgi:hypothetical protein